MEFKDKKFTVIFLCVVMAIFGALVIYNFYEIESGGDTVPYVNIITKNQ